MKKKKEDKIQPFYLIKFKNAGKKHYRTLQTKDREEIKQKLNKLGFYDNLNIVEITRVL